MQILAEQIQQDLKVTQNTVLTETVYGTITVTSNNSLELYGNLIGDLYLEPSTEAILYSMVKGNIYNQGGHLRIEGVVKGSVYRQQGHTVLSPQAMVEHLV